MPFPATDPAAMLTDIELLETRWGPMYGFRNDRGVSEALRIYGEYGTDEIALYERLLEPGDAAVDVGCNIGVVAKALGHSAPGRTVLALEPQPDCFRLATVNTFAHAGVSVYQLAASDSAGVVPIQEIDRRRPGNYGNHRINPDQRGGRPVPCATVRLDAFLAPRVPAPRLVKIDTEGMEAAVVRGLAGLRHDRLVISAEADRRPLVPALIDELQALGCACFVAYFRPIPASNPRFDFQDRHCRTLHIHLLGFAGTPSDWIAGVPGVWPIRSAAEFDKSWSKFFPGEAARVP